MPLATPHLDLDAGSLIAGKYRILRSLGAGGFGQVFAAENINLGTPVAIKVSHRSGPDERVWREARAAARLKSPHTVRVYDIDQLRDGTPYIVMEFLHGKPLRELLQEQGQVEPAQAIDWTIQLCEALAEAHAANIIHRDIKPSNIFVVDQGGRSPQVKLVDFGLAKTIDAVSESTITESGVVLGSPAYMSPEQLRSVVTPSTDIWSLGVVLFEMLSGRRPFRADTAPAILAAIVADAVPPLDSVVPGLPPALVEVVSRCLRKTPKERFPSVLKLSEALSQCTTPGRTSTLEGDTTLSSSAPTTLPNRHATKKPRGKLWIASTVGAAGILVWWLVDFLPPDAQRRHPEPSSSARSGAQQASLLPPPDVVPELSAISKQQSQNRSIPAPSASATSRGPRAARPQAFRIRNGPAPKQTHSEQQSADFSSRRAPVEPAPQPTFFEEPDF